MDPCAFCLLHSIHHAAFASLKPFEVVLSGPIMCVESLTNLPLLVVERVSAVGGALAALNGVAALRLVRGADVSLYLIAMPIAGRFGIPHDFHLSFLLF